MDRWSGAFGEIRVRRFDEILAVPVGAPPFDYATYLNPISAFLAASWSASDGPNQITSYPGKPVDYVSINCAAYSKFMHVLDCAREEITRGAFTWGLVDAYHCSLMGARSILAALGVLVVNSSGRTLLVDLFPEHGSKDDRKRFAREYKNITSPVRVMAPRKSLLLEQTDLWALVKRLITLRSFSTNREEQLQLALVDLIDAKPWQGRNQVLYDVTSWKWGFDIGLSPLSSAQVESLLLTTDQVTSDFIFFVDAIYELVDFYVRQLVARTGVPSLTLPSGVTSARLPTILN